MFSRTNENIGLTILFMTSDSSVFVYAESQIMLSGSWSVYGVRCTSCVTSLWKVIKKKKKRIKYEISSVCILDYESSLSICSSLYRENWEPLWILPF